MALTNKYADYSRMEKSFLMCFLRFIVVYFSVLV